MISKMKLKNYFFIVAVYYAVTFALPTWANSNSILVVGDSISSAYGMDYEKGWVNLLQARLSEASKDYKVINASITGDVSASGRGRIVKLLDQHKPDLVIIELGGNDGLRGLSIDDLKTNLESMITDSIDSGAKVLLAGMKILPNYGPRYTLGFEKVYQDLAEEYSIALIPFILEGIGGVPANMQADGIHPNEQAQPIIVDNVWEHLAELL